MRKYLMLSRSRPPAFSDIANIPISEVRAVYEMFDMDELLPADEFIDYVQFLDDVFREWYRKHGKKSS